MTAACHRHRALVHALAEGELDERQLVNVRRHATDCVACAGVLQGARTVLSALRREAEQPLPPPPEGLVRDIMVRVPRYASPRYRISGMAAGLLLGGLLLSASLGGLLPDSGGITLLPELRAALVESGHWMSRFAALYQAAGGFPGLPNGGTALSAMPSVMPGLGLIGSGLAGLAMALTLGLRRPPA